MDVHSIYNSCCLWGEKTLFLLAILFGIGLLTLVHEFGHFLFCRLFGVPVPIFSIGMGPHLFSRTYKGTKFALSAIPFGGYVAIGSSNEHEPQEEANLLAKYSLYKGGLILLGGIICNFLLAYIFSIGLALTYNLETTSIKPFLATPLIESVLADSCAEKACLLPGDRIISIDEKPVESGYEIKKAFSENSQSEKNEIQFMRGSTCSNCTIERPSESAKIGIICALEQYHTYTLRERVYLGIRVVNAMIKATFNGVLELIHRRKMQNCVGFIGILQAGFNAAKEGMVSLIAILIFISINLAIVNLIPLPILDGGHLLLLVIAKIYGKPLTDRTQQMFFYFSIIIIGMLTLFTTFYDIVRWIGW